MGDSAGRNKGGGSKARIGEGAKCVCLNALRRGARHEEAAREAGFSRSAFFRLRRRDPAFAALWEDAIDHSSGPRYVCGGKSRLIQLRRNRRVAFTEERKRVFLEHFAATCNLAASAEAAGVSQGVVFDHRKSDPVFAAGLQASLEQGYERLEAYVLQRRLEAQQALQRTEAKGEPEPEFERALKLLQRWERKDGRLGPREIGHGRIKRGTFDEAIEAIERKLKALGIPVRQVPPDAEPKAEEDK